MKFCPECDSILYYEETDNILMEKCKQCGYNMVCTDRIIETTIYKSSQLQSNDMRNYARYDPTLPRTIHKECPNINCPSRKNKLIQEAVFYSDPNTMKLIYTCTVCNTQWQYA